MFFFFFGDEDEDDDNNPASVGRYKKQHNIHNNKIF